jgi:hypothetical protein
LHSQVQAADTRFNHSAKNRIDPALAYMNKISSLWDQLVRGWFAYRVKDWP